MALACRVALPILGAITFAAALTAQSPVRYIYDELGRLVGVIDPSGNAAAYHYDAVGNLLSITRSTPTTVAIIEVTPDAGAVGQSVTIYGTGFGATSGQNTVTFNGTTASIASASTTQLVVMVPAGATTGLVAVTSPHGSDTSEASFTVTASGAPTITSFSPAAAVAGATVTITGTNFDASSPAHNPSRVNVTLTSPTAATSTTVTAVVPAKAGSGRLTVRTAAGTAVSADDFIVPPPPFVVADVASASRLAFATPTTVTIGTATKIALRLFDGAVGQRVSLLGTNGVTGQILGCDLSASLLTPFASALAPAACMEQSGFLDVQTLMTAGTHTILVDPAGAATGSVTLTLYDVPADVSATITPGGSSVTATMTTPGQNGVLTFAGTSGQRISLVGTNGISGQIGLVCDVFVSVLKPDGSALAAPSCMEGSGYVDVMTLPATGIYKIVVDPTSAVTGSLTLTLYHVPADFSGSITPGGAPVTVAMPTPGQNGVLTFSGTSGQRISLAGTNGLLGFILGCDVNVRILKPDASALAPPACMEHSGYIDVLTLPTTGTYTIVVDPVGQAVGNLTLTLYAVPADASGTITAGGSAVTVSMPTPGQNGALTFAGTAGQRVSLVGTNGLLGYVFGCDVDVRILKPDTTVLVANTCMELSGFIDATTLPVTGTYTIVVDPVGQAVGTLTLTLYAVPADASGTITAGGAAVTVSMPTPGQNGTRTFSGTSGQRISLHGTNGLTGFIAFACDVHVRVLKPDASVLVANTCMEGSGFIDRTTLPVTGTYTIVVDPIAQAVGTLTLRLYSVPADASGTITAGGSAVTVSMPTPGQNGTRTFSGTSGQRISLTGTNGLAGFIAFDCDVYVRILKPDASVLVANTCMEGSGFIDTTILPVAGTYTIAVDPVAQAVGNLTLRLYTVPADTTGTVTIGGPAVAVTLSTPGRNGRLTFSGTASQQVTVRMAGNTYGAITVQLLKPDGSELTSTVSSAASFTLTTHTLPTTGTYTIVVNPSGPSTGAVNVNVTNP